MSTEDIAYLTCERPSPDDSAHIMWTTNFNATACKAKSNVMEFLKNVEDFYVPKTESTRKNPEPCSFVFAVIFRIDKL
jgi:hypothetical protein